MESTNNIRILVVDDEVRFLQTLTQRLTRRDFAVTSVTNGQDALEAVQDQEFDLALLDLKMPGMSGEQLLEKIKEIHPYIEVVILTGHGSIDSAVYCTQQGSHSYLQKPCETDELLGVLKDAYQKRVARKLKLDEERMAELLGTSLSESPLGILRKLREIEGK